MCEKTNTYAHNGISKKGLIRFSLKTALLTGSIITSSAAFAQDDTTDVIQVTAPRMVLELNQVPASIAVLDKQEIEQLAPNKLSDLLRYEPGITVDRTGDRHGDANIIIRGIGGNRVLMVKDGVLMPEGFGSAGASQGRGNFDPFQLQQIEVLKGPASALYGSNALGGVVLIKSAEPETLVNSNGGAPYLSANAGYFGEDNRYRIGGTVAGEIGSSHAMIQVQHQQFEETDINSDFAPNPKDGNANNVLFKWQVKSGDNQTFNILADYFRQDSDIQLNTNIGPIAGPPGTSITSSEAEDKSENMRFALTHEIADLSFADKLQWQVSYQYSNYKQYELETTENPGSVFPPIPASEMLDEEREEFEQKQFGASFTLQKKFGDHNFLIGSDFTHRSVTRPVDRLQTDVIAGTSTDVINGFQYPGKTFPDAKVTQVGIFLQDYYDLLDNLHITAGIRYDYFKNKPEVDQQYQNFNIANAVPATYSDEAFSPHIGMVFDATDSLSLFANYATGFRSPPVAEQYISRSILIPVPGVPHEVIPNNDLSAETSDGFEVGLRLRNDVISAEIAAYHNNYDNFIDSQTIGFRNQPPIFVGPTAIRQIQYQNIEEVRIKGIEFSSKIFIDSVLPDGWSGSLNMAASFIDGKNKITDTGLNSVPPHSYVLGISLSPAEEWQFHWHLRGAGTADDAEPLTQQGQPLPAFEPPAYSVQDVSIRWALNENLNVMASVYNLTNKKYWGAHSKGSNAAGNLDASAAPGRSFAASVGVRF